MNQIKILLVDDEEELVTTLSQRMSMRNFGTNIALDGEQALKLVENEIPDVVVLDLKMPGIDGIEVLRRLRNHYPAIQVIILTGHGTDKDENEARELGAYAYLNKPVDIELLVSTIKDAYFEGSKLQESG
jgi:DNA-binding response OmpR family regulator